MRKGIGCPPEILMNETPSVIGVMSVTLSSGGSFDTAVREIAKSGPENMSRLFGRIVLDADSRVISDIGTAIMELVSSFPKQLSPFKRAMHIVVTAFDSSEPKERDDMMKDAERIVLEGLRNIGESYSSSLTTPCMMIFGLGILLPMVMISMLPMLSVGGMFSVSSIDSRVVKLLVLVMIPSVVGSLVMSIRGKNPFHKAVISPGDVRFLIPLSIAVPVYFLLKAEGLSDDLSISAAFAIAGLVTFMTICPSLLREKERSKTEEALKDVLFELGNRMSMGENFENAVIKALGSRDECAQIRIGLERELVLCRGDIGSAVHAVLSPISSDVASCYRDICRASVRDVRNAGRLALGIAHQLQDQNNVRKGIENKLKSTMDMMTGTSSLFAPIILGMSIVMLGPISEITGHVFFEDIGLTLTIYLIELAALISLMSSNLMCKGKTIDTVARFCAIMPVSLIVFSVCSSLSI